ncbi:hypothetical protein IMCC3135_33655 [Granulosicoccus antarcticus IMCC3135]|uniref:Uncharacterized protein n=1 Tax=Granulosicoccus antarcticus IMCC3135 TaxID=1192854 RepID=A0A2Z2NZ84_9GAMM|nr:hypothetical protein IMCC3135_33655 [Granulosicoccus antarcticus IMCC3135]
MSIHNVTVKTRNCAFVEAGRSVAGLLGEMYGSGIETIRSQLIEVINAVVSGANDVCAVRIKSCITIVPGQFLKCSSYCSTSPGISDH